MLLVLGFLRLLCLPGAVGQSGISATFGQPGEGLQGKVIDESGAAIPGATITVFSDDRVVTVNSDRSGEWRFDRFPPSAHEIAATATGFNSIQIPVRELACGGLTSFTFVLKVRTSGGVCPDVDLNHYSLLYENRHNAVHVSGTALKGTVLLLFQEDRNGPTVTIVQAGRDKPLLRQILVATAMANDAGEFQFAFRSDDTDLTPGWYDLKAVHDGYWDGDARFWVARNTLTRLPSFHLLPKSEFCH
jgi:hypothetical protein